MRPARKCLIEKKWKALIYDRKLAISDIIDSNPSMRTRKKKKEKAVNVTRSRFQDQLRENNFSLYLRH